MCQEVILLRSGEVIDSNLVVFDHVIDSLKMSLARQNFADLSEQAINAQIDAELKASHTYLAMAAYFARDSVALPGFRAFFQASSDEERAHAQKLIAYQGKRGGRVQIGSVAAPEVCILLVIMY